MADLLQRLQAAVGPAYVIERELGGGGMSRVFLVEEIRFHRRVVIKLLAPELTAGVSVERFEREIKVASNLQQANIVPVLDTGTLDGLPWYSMPYVAGESLRERLDRGRVSITESVAILCDIARALSYAHQQGIVHRDIKPQNVLLSGGTGVVTDFGIAKALHASRTDVPGSTLTGTGMSLGTPAYIAPEQAVGDTVDERADLYAWGIVAYELLTGHHPFAARSSAQQLIAAHLTETPPPILGANGDIPCSLAKVVMRCLAKDRAQRPSSASELITALDEARSVAPRQADVRTLGQRLFRPLLSVTVLLVLAWIAVQAVRTPTLVALFAGAHTPAIGSVRSVAVLPFANTGGEMRDEYFSDGMTDELAHALTRVPSLRVVARSSSYAYKGRAVAAEQVGAALHVEGLVEGTVRRSGNRLRLTVQLTNAADGTVMWSENYESAVQDIFQIQDEFTKSIISSLVPAIHGQRTARTETTRGTTSVAAYDLYLRGRYFWERRGPEGIARSIDCFRRAILADPGFARAYAGLALAYVVQPNYDGRVPPLAASAAAETASTRAIALDSSVSEAHLALAYALTKRFAFADAEREYAIAAQQDSGNATLHHWRALHLAAQGRLTDAISEIERARALDPLQTAIINSEALLLYEDRQFAQSIRAARRALDLDSTFAAPYTWMAMSYAFRGLPDSAMRYAPHLLASRRHTGRQLFIYAAAGHWGDAERLRVQIERDETNGQSFNRVLAGVVFGKPAQTTQLLEESIRSGEAAAANAMASCDPVFDRLKTDPAYISLMRRFQMHICPATTPWPIAIR